MKKSILITGASSGIGMACAELFGRNGYRVFATFRSSRDREKFKGLPNVHPVQMDVTNAEDIRRAFREVSAALNGAGLYALLNNAGITYTAPFEYADEPRARQVMEVNLMAPFKITQAFLPLLKQHYAADGQKARVVNIASWAGYMGQPFIPFYNASKAAVIALSESMFYDLGLLDIHVVVASPGVTKTALLEKTTSDGVLNLQAFPTEGQAFYKPYFDHYQTMSERSRNSKFFPTPEKIADRLLRIVEVKKPKFKYNLAPDAVIVDKVLTRFLPFRWRVAMNKRMFRLNRKAGA